MSKKSLNNKFIKTSSNKGAFKYDDKLGIRIIDGVKVSNVTEWIENWRTDETEKGIQSN